MSSLPRFIDPYRFAEKAKSLVGEVGIKQCGRLRELVLSLDGSIKSELRFLKHGSKTKILGQVTARVSVACQACLEELSLDIVSDVMLEVLSGLDQVETLDDAFDPLLVMADDGMIDLFELVEDEVILAIPQYPKHTTCDLKIGGLERGDDLKVSKASASPFDILNNLKLPNKSRS